MVAFMTPILKVLISRLLPDGESNLEWSRVRLRIFNAHFVCDRVFIDAREALGDASGLAEAYASPIRTDTGLVAEKIGGFDDKRILFKMPAGISHVGADGASDVRAAI